MSARRDWWVKHALVVAVVTAAWGGLQVQAQTADPLAPQDYIAIQQLVSKYAYAIDECTNRGYDYADLYTPDGAFYTSRAGKILGRFEGRERLAEACHGPASSTCSSTT